MKQILKRPDTQHGFSLLEILAALALAALMMTSLNAMVDVSLQDTKSQQVARYHEQFTAAASRYVNDNAAALFTDAGGGTQTVTHAQLTAGGYLPNGFAPTNAYSQIPCVLVRQHAAAGASNALDALVVTVGGTAIPPKDLSYIAANAGSGGGQIDFGKPAGAALIAYGLGWELNNAQLSQFITTSCPDGAAGNGSLASALFYGGPNGINRDVLYRGDVGDPMLNRMTVPLGMGGTAIAAAGALCGPSPAIAMDNNRNILTCDATGRWNGGSSWKQPVANFGALAGVTPLPQDGDVRMTLDTGRAFTFSASASAWQPLAIDQNGNFTVLGPGNIRVEGGNIDVVNGNVNIPLGTLAANNVNATLDVRAGQDLRAARDLQVARDIFATQNITARQGNVVAELGDVLAQSGDVRSVNGNVVAQNALVGDSVSTSPKVVGDRCNFFGATRSGAPVVIYSRGTIVTDPNGVIMECKPAGGPGAGGSFIYVDGTSPATP